MLSNATFETNPREDPPMKKLLFVLLLIPVLGWAQSPFDGTWKIDLGKSKLPKKPDEYLLKDGMYECKTCKPRDQDQGRRTVPEGQRPSLLRHA